MEGEGNSLTLNGGGSGSIIDVTNETFNGVSSGNFIAGGAMYQRPIGLVPTGTNSVLTVSGIEVFNCFPMFQDEKLEFSLKETIDFDNIESYVKEFVDWKNVHAVDAVRGPEWTKMQYSSVLECIQSICLHNFNSVSLAEDPTIEPVVFFNPFTNATCRVDLQEGFASDGSYLDIQDQVKRFGYVPLEALNPALFDLEKMENVSGECVLCNGILKAIGLDMNLNFWAARCRYCHYTRGGSKFMSNSACVWPGDDFSRLVEVMDQETMKKGNVVFLKPLKSSYASSQEYVEILEPLVKWEMEEEKRIFSQARIIGKLHHFEVINNTNLHSLIAVTIVLERNEISKGESFLMKTAKVSVEIVPHKGFAVLASVSSCLMMSKDELDPTHYYVNLLIESQYEPSRLSPGDYVYITPHRNDVVMQSITNTLEEWLLDDSAEDVFITQCLLGPKMMLSRTCGMIDTANLFITDPSLKINYHLLAKRLKKEEVEAIEYCLTSGLSQLERSSEPECHDITAKVLIALKCHFPLQSTIVIGATSEICETFCSTVRTIMDKMWCGPLPFRVLHALSFQKELQARKTLNFKNCNLINYLHDKTDEIVKKGHNARMKAIQQHLEDNSFWKVEEHDALSWKKYVAKIERNQMESTKYRVIVATMESFTEHEMESLFTKRSRNIDSVIVINAAKIPQVKLVPLSRLEKANRLVLASAPFDSPIPQPITTTGKLADFSKTLIDCMK